MQGGASYSWEHLEFQQGAKAHPALKKKFVRQAIITGINRAQIREVLYVKTGLVESNKDMPVLNSVVYKPFEAAYKPAYGRWKFSQKNAIALLKKNGCTGGPDTPSAGNSKIFSCPGVGELKFAFTTTSGNPLRALTFEIIQRQLKSVGIELTPRFISPAVLFGGGTLTSGDWQMVMFTFIGGPTSHMTFFGTGGCGGDQNYNNSCNPKSTCPAEEGAVHGRRGRAKCSASASRCDHGGRRLPRCRCSRGRRMLLRSVKVTGVAQEPDPAGHHLERRDLESVSVVRQQSTCRARSAQRSPRPRRTGGGGVSF